MAMLPTQGMERSPWFTVTPPEHPGVHVERTRLSDLLDTATDGHRVTVLAAPAGFGKSTALAGWARRHGDPIAWLTLSPFDEDPTRLYRGILTALHDVALWLGPAPAPVMPDPATDHRQIFDSIVSWVRERGAPTRLVIDDCHLAGLSRDSALGMLVEHGPEQLRIVLAGRELDASLARQAVYAELAVVGPAELAFTPQEALQAAGQLQQALDLDQARALVDRVGGWPVAVRLALGSTRTDEIAVDSSDGAAGIVDLVETEILGTDSLRDFVLAATTSTMVDARLAAALSGRDDAGALLEECVRRGLFVDRFHRPDLLDVYRWHDVFVGACRAIVRRHSLQESRRLHRIAAEWLAARVPLVAAQHALQADEPRLSADILSRDWPHLVVTADTQGLLDACVALPEAWRERPEILLIRSSCLAVRGDPVGARLLRERAAVPDDPSTDLAIASALTDLLTADEHGVRLAACDRLQHELAREHRLTPRAFAAALFIEGWAEARLRLAPERTRGTLRAALSAAESCGDLDLARRSAVNLMLAEVLAGRFHESERLARDELARVLRESDWRWFDEGMELFASGLRAYWRADHAQAEADFHAVVTQLDATGMVGAMSRVFRALNACAARDLTLVDTTERDLTHIRPSETYGLPWTAYVTVARAAIADVRGRVPAATELAARVERSEYLPAVLPIAAEILRKHGRIAEAEAAVEVLQQGPLPSYGEAMVLMTSAVGHRARGRFVVAHRLLEHGLDLVVAEDLRRVLNLDDPHLLALLTEHASWGSRHEALLADLLASREQAESIAGTLSHREKQVLAYMRTTMSVAEIAAALHVSVNTVKTHQRAIYRKLGVNSRRAAVGTRV